MDVSVLSSCECGWKRVFIMCACVSHWFRNLWPIWWIARITFYAYFSVFIVLQLAVDFLLVLVACHMEDLRFLGAHPGNHFVLGKMCPWGVRKNNVAYIFGPAIRYVILLIYQKYIPKWHLNEQFVGLINYKRNISKAALSTTKRIILISLLVSIII